MSGNIAIVLEEGLVAMIVGMTVVFLFLIIMIFSMDIMSKIVLWLNKIFPEQIVETAKKVKKVATGGEEEVAVAVAAALHKK